MWQAATLTLYNFFRVIPLHISCSTVLVFFGASVTVLEERTLVIIISSSSSSVHSSRQWLFSSYPPRPEQSSAREYYLPSIAQNPCQS
mmetsp:Transcript_50833/g.61256  ORF Transcript_50833/g.61256 Transcript_50833/m.61256 type:complete len:88 (-) Transcript_50833:511-774(-)